MKDNLTELPESIGFFVLEHSKYGHVETKDGLYFHFLDVVQLLAKYAEHVRHKRTNRPHFIILGSHTGEPIGCTNGIEGIESVLSEEPPETSFQKVDKASCPICNEM